ncbi:MAG TPA: UvrD-helicase domain-containing protein [Gemmatimonadaceae bacterium]|nr:UvrD-helicase domain-containing protein [Gemmatimonadaceae bacterium]
MNRSTDTAAEQIVSGDAEPLSRLNPAQREAVLHHEGPMLVIAGAGSGKTRVLTTRIAWLIRNHGVDPSRILAVTFTNKAAGEMRERIASLLDDEDAFPGGHAASAADVHKMWCGTFHAIGARILRSNAPRVGRTANFTIYDEDDSLGIIKRVMERVGVSPKKWTPKSIAAIISDAKNALVTPAQFQETALDPLSRAAASVYVELEGALRTANAVSFDDLLVLPVQILRENPDVLERYRSKFDFILVDEYQDTNRAQFQFIKHLGSGHGNVAVVGDDDQSIYGWRGADIRNILDFEKEFASAKIVRLEENYRSTPGILELANVAISANIGRRGKTLRATRPGGEQVTLVAALDERDEADFVVDEIRSRQASESRRLEDFAILYRTNSQSRPMEDALRKNAMPYRLIGAVRFYDRREIRDLMSYLKLIANPSDDEAFRRAVSVPKRKLGETTIEAVAMAARTAGVSILDAASRPELLGAVRPAAREGLKEFAEMIRGFRERAKEASVDELLRELVDAIRYGDYLQAEAPESARDRIENVAALIDGAAETVVDEGGEVGLTPLDHFLQRAMLVAAIDTLDPDADGVTLMTLHNAKGLEFPVVFITGLEDGLFPTSQSFDDPPKLEEERRLFYVGITRAERKLYITHAEARRRNGEFMPSIKSRFLKEIPAGMMEERRTLKVRTAGRSYSREASWQEAPYREPGAWRTQATRMTHQVPSYRPAAVEEKNEEESLYRPGERITHRLFGGGAIVEVTGLGRDVKAIIDFDDQAVGRKTIKLAYTTLERGSP